MEKKLDIPPSNEEVEYQENVSKENEEVEEVFVRSPTSLSEKQSGNIAPSFKTISPKY